MAPPPRGTVVQPAVKILLTLTAVGRIGFAVFFTRLQVDAVDPSGGVPIGLGMLCMVTAMLAVSGLLGVLAAWLSRFIVGRDD
ncbi:hypothetical protein [Kocuria salsicia]|uniref:Uncharacterized protein n=1 Tax=Kocuria salsicia TaxID=664639 RepID=A0ABV3KED8_9MICC